MSVIVLSNTFPSVSRGLIQFQWTLEDWTTLKFPQR
jgi:hypothetical protein